ncbi:MAG: TetR/AcrR family transcriptional regulator [Cytophagales bacterium]|nr:TetR/AcrR family transcriptional regulator [Cytophagales bacterium]
MKHPLTDEWIRAGYGLFAERGPLGLKVEQLALVVGKSKSSFYHHFADLEIFTSALVDYHLHRARVIAEQEAACSQIDPDLIALILEVKQDLLFSRQLRIHRNVPLFKACFEQSNELASAALLQLWARDLDLPMHGPLPKMMLGLVMENFYLQLSTDTLSATWLRAYFQGIRQMVGEFKKIMETP